MKIWICHQYALAPHHAGVTRHFMLAREFVQRGHDVTIIAAAISHKNPEGCALRDDEKFRQEVYDGVKFLWLRTPSFSEKKILRVWNMLFFSFRILALRGIGRPDVIIGNTPDPFTALAAMLRAKSTHVLYALHIGDLWPLSLVDIGGISPFHPFILLLGLIERVLYRFSDYIVTPLPRAAAYIVSKGGAADKISQVPIVVDPAEIPDLPDLPYNDVFTFMYAGSIGPGNGAETIVRAAAAFEEKYTTRLYRLRLIGEGGEKGRLQALADELGIRHISFEPAVSKRDIYRRLAEADVFIVNIANLRVFRESGISPNKIFDFMMMGRPIIIGCSAANNPVLAAEAGLCVAGDDAAGMAEKMAAVMDLPLEARKIMGRNGRAYIEKNNDVRQVIDDLERILVSLTEKKCGKRI